MVKIPITYTDYNGNTRTEDHHFGLNRSEIVMFQNSVNGGITEVIKQFINKSDQVELMKTFKELILMSYGEKSADGRRFRKVADDGVTKLAVAFMESPAFDELYMDLMSNSTKCAEFINQIMPAGLADGVEMPKTEAEARKMLEELQPAN